VQPPLELPLDPGRDGWGPYDAPSLPPGWFFNTEVDVIHPVLRARLSNDTPLIGTGTTLAVPGAPLHWTAAPWLDAAYRLPRSLGFFSINYRFFTSEGGGSGVLADNPADVRSRLDENLINLDYGTTPYAILPRCSCQWRIGVQLADVFFDSSIRNGTGAQSASNSFRGAGPHARLELDHHLPFGPGLSLYGRLEGAGVLGRISQKFREEITNPGGGPANGFWEQNGTQMVPTLLVQAGLDYVPPRRANWRLSLGYVYERWWYVGQLGEDSNAGTLSNTRGEFGTQGVFLRGQVDF
jgi:hypothetical protein